MRHPAGCGRGPRPGELLGGGYPGRLIHFVTSDELLRIALYASRGLPSRHRPDCIQEAVTEILARPDRHPIRAAENGVRRWLHRERRQHRRRIGPPRDDDRIIQPPDHAPALDLATMLGILPPRDAGVLLAEATRSRSDSRPQGTPWDSSTANIASRARARIRATFPHY